MARGVRGLYLMYRSGPLMLSQKLLVFGIVVAVLLNPLKSVILAAIWLLSTTFDTTLKARTLDGDDGDLETVRTTINS